MRHAILYATLLIVSSSTCRANTWTVQQDGLGDYSVIQDAVDAAASGDTILIGPGRFDEKQVRTCMVETDSVRIFVTQEVLTIIGSGPDETIIGQSESWDLSQGHHLGVFADSYCGNQVLNLIGLRMENMGYAVFAGTGAKSTIRDCMFYGNHFSVDAESDTTIISDCRFQNMARNGNYVLSYYQNYLQLDNCSGIVDPANPWPQVHLHLQSTQTANINHCNFQNGFGGLTVAGVSHAVASDCVFNQQDGYGVGLEASGLPIATLTGCTFSGQFLAFRQDTGFGRWEIEGTTVTDVTLATLGFGNLGGGYIRDSILAKGERYVVMDFLGLKNGSELDMRFDMTDNWWGTTNPDSIQAWIFDGNDDPDSGFIIDWDPYKDQPVAVEEKSLGSLKSLYR